jgi:hypothetical protein
MDHDTLNKILVKHDKWTRGEIGGERATLTGANLTGATLTGANLTGAYLTGAYLDVANLAVANLAGANLTGANLTGANLAGANLTGANLTGANLDGANLTGANLAGAKIDATANITGEPWGEYLEKVVPALLTASGKSLAEVVASGCWDCHEWANCPMAVAFGIDEPKKAPLLLRPRVEQFVRLFDAKLIPCPVIESARNLLPFITVSAKLAEACRELEAFFGVMHGHGEDAIIPEIITTPLGIKVKSGDIVRELRSAIADYDAITKGDST